MKYAIIAAGEGSRLRHEGFKDSKPMVSLYGERLIERLLRIFKNNEAESITIIINEESESLKQLLKQRQEEGLEINLIVKSTPSSLHSFYEICLTKPTEICLTTVDTIFDEKRFAQYISEFKSNRQVDALMGVTSFVDDEKPLWIAEDSQKRIIEYSSVHLPKTNVVSGGIYCFRHKAIEKVFQAIDSGMSRMRNYQSLLVESGLNVRAFDFGKIIDIDHLSDIAKAEQMLATQEKDTIVALRRAGVYSPNSIAKDDGIFFSVCNQLRDKGFIVNQVEEDTLLQQEIIRPQYVFSMARNPKVVKLLSQWEKEGTKVSNSSKGCRNCYRAKAIELLEQNNISIPKTIIIDTDIKEKELYRVLMHFEDKNGRLSLWIKRGDFQTQIEEDVCRPHTLEQAIAIIISYNKRGIQQALLSQHIEGDVIKCYAVRGSNFFHYFYPTEDKFHFKVNENKQNTLFDEQELQALAQECAKFLDLDFFGIDVVVEQENQLKVIDVNDFPSYSSCLQEASRAITDLIVKENKCR